MYVVIFRAKIRADLSESSAREYDRVAQQMRDLAIGTYGCVDFVAMTDNGDELAVSYWPDEASIIAWREDAEHRKAQECGKRDWYIDYSVEVLTIERRYESASTLKDAAKQRGEDK